jgi:hypothetical protein
VISVLRISILPIQSDGMPSGAAKVVLGFRPQSPALFKYSIMG